LKASVKNSLSTPHESNEIHLISTFLKQDTFPNIPLNAYLEKEILQVIRQKIGYLQNATGHGCSSATLALLTALLLAQQKLRDAVSADKQAIIVSSAAYANLGKVIQLLGIPQENIFVLPLPNAVLLDEMLLQQYYNQARSQGKIVMAILGTVLSNTSCTSDDLMVMAQFCANYGLWFHVDALYAGAAIFSTAYQNKLAGIAHADSIGIEIYSQFIFPQRKDFLLLKTTQPSVAHFMNLARSLCIKASLEEVRLSASTSFDQADIQFYTLLKNYGTKGLDLFVTQLYDLAHMFAQDVRFRSDFELVVPAQFNRVCFRYVLPAWTADQLNLLNATIGEYLMIDGDGTILRIQEANVTYLQIRFFDPNVSGVYFSGIFNKIQRLATVLSAYLRVEREAYRF